MNFVEGPVNARRAMSVEDVLLALVAVSRFRNGLVDRTLQPQIGLQPVLGRPLRTCLAFILRGAEALPGYGLLKPKRELLSLLHHVLILR